jgi:hypothetical protein
MTADHAGAGQVLTAGSPVPVIQTQSFCFSYPGANRPAVRDVAFAVERGEIFGFLGPSGAGNATLPFDDTTLLDSAKVGILSGSILSGVVGAIVLRRGTRSASPRPLTAGGLAKHTEDLVGGGVRPEPPS